MRPRFIKSIVILCSVVLILCLWYMQCVEGRRYLELSKKNSIRLVSINAPRGNIYDRHGDILASSRIAFDCVIIPQEFKSDSEKLKELSLILQVPVAFLKKRIKEDIVAPFIPLVLKRDIGKETAIAISEKNVDFPGLIIHTYPVRHYPYCNIGSHVLGYLGKISEEELDALRDYGYNPKDIVGRGGLELYYDDYLKGDDGGMQVEVDSRGRELRMLGLRGPEKGRDVTVTIDLELEKYIDSLLEGSRGAIVVMGVNSGEILGFVSKPDFDPNIFVSAVDPAMITKLMKRRDYPLVNRAISGAYPPGSTFKVVTASAALELKKIDNKELLDCKGIYMLGRKEFECWRSAGHGFQTLSEGIKNSCNVFFYQLGRRIGADGLSDYALRYGFGSPTEIDLPYEMDGTVPSRIWKRRYKKELWYDGDSVNFAIGQGYLLVTPMQILQMINALATEGELAKPFVAKKIDSVEIFGTEKRRLDVSKETFKIIKESTRRAVEDENGTAGRARVEGLKIAGKTGTAQTGSEETHAWFAGFSPIEEPKISLVVFLEYGGMGGDKPCRIAASIFTKLKELGYL